MKKFIFLSFFSLFLSLNIQAQVADDFSDGDISSAPAWTGDIAAFVTEGEQLRSNGPEDKSLIYLSTELTTTELQEWQLFIDLKFAPSGSNQIRFYLLADSSNLPNAAHGYFLELGQSGEDRFHLKEITNGKVSTILSSNASFSAEVTTTIKVVYGSGHWKLYLKEYDFILDTSAAATFNSIETAYTGISCKYTSTRKDKFYFDDFYAGPAVVDTSSPHLLAAEVLDKNNLQLMFNESISLQDKQALLLNDLYVPETYEVVNNKLHLNFVPSFREGENTLAIAEVQDLSGNALRDTTITFLFYTISAPLAGDLLINEFMADPSPPVELPEAEYVELWNSSDKHFDLSQLLLNGRTISEEKVLLLSGDYIILCPANYQQDFLPYGKVIGMPSWDILKNSEDEIILSEITENTVIDAIHYTADWFDDTNKKKGGFAIERISTTFPCQQKYNWAFSKHMEGGTPGGRNSVADVVGDDAPPVIEYTVASDSGWVKIKFNEPLSRMSVQVSDFSSPEVLFSKITSHEDESIVFLQADQLFRKNETYHLKIRRLADCYGNELAEINSTFVLPDSLAAGDILLTEVLFDPYPTGVDFIEVYNASGKVLNLQDLFISNDSTRQYLLTATPKMISPGTYMAFTSDTTKVASDYPRHGKLHAVQAMPFMPNDEGEVYLLDREQNILDNMSYNKEQHLAILADVEGISLEKISLEGSSRDTENWQSASSTAGYATPGLENSQNLLVEASDKIISFSSPWFTPNQDGDQDILSISYSLLNAGMVGSFTIFDPYGNEIVQLANNATLEVSGNFFWDGITKEGVLAKTGHYILVAEIHSIQGDLVKVKEKFALIR